MKIFIGLPCYDFKVYSDTMISIFSNMNVLKNEGHEIGIIHCDNGNCYVSDSRNKIADKFMKTDCDYLVFVDSDVAFDDSAISNLIATDKKIVGGVYPSRSDEKKYMLQVKTDSNAKILRDGNYFECEYLPTGLLKIHRSVFDAFRNKYPEEQGNHYYTYFENKLDKKTGLWTGEDVYFCKKCNEMGEKVWCYPMIDFKHFGVKAFEGNYYKYLKEACK